MAVNIIVVAITVLMLIFCAIWYFCPWLRPWIEAPKYRILRRRACAGEVQSCPPNDSESGTAPF